MLRALDLLLVLTLSFLMLPLTGCQREAAADIKIEGIEPQDVNPGETVTITVSGKGFSARPNDIAVKIGDAEAQVKSSSNNRIVVEVPRKLRPGSYNLMVADRRTGRSSDPAKLRILEPQVVTVPAGTRLVVRTVDRISSQRNRQGDAFLLTLDEPLEVDGRIVAPKGSEVVGRVIDVKQPGRVKGRAEIGFTLVELKPRNSDRTYRIVTNSYYSRARGTKRRDALIIGTGAGIGTAIGAIAGGGKGAAIGAAAGGAAGTGAVLLTRGNHVAIPSETRFVFRLREPIEARISRSSS